MGEWKGETEALPPYHAPSCMEKPGALCNRIVHSLVFSDLGGQKAVMDQSF